MNDKRVEAAAKAMFFSHKEYKDLSWDNMFKQDKDYYRDKVSTILKASDAAAWQPIETAPRDGTLILVAVKHIGCDVVSFWGAGWRETTNGLMLRDEPTHWQPLPAPPSDATP